MEELIKNHEKRVIHYGQGLNKHEKKSMFQVVVIYKPELICIHMVVGLYKQM